MKVYSYILVFSLLLLLHGCDKDTGNLFDNEQDKIELGPLVKAVKIYQFERGDFVLVENLVPEYNGIDLSGIRRLGEQNGQPLDAINFDRVLTGDKVALFLTRGDVSPYWISKWTIESGRLASFTFFAEGWSGLPSINSDARYAYEANGRLQSVKIYPNEFSDSTYFSVERFIYRDREIASFSEIYLNPEVPEEVEEVSAYSISYQAESEIPSKVNAFLFNHVTMVSYSSILGLGFERLPSPSNIAYFWRYPFSGISGTRLISSIDIKSLNGDRLVDISYERDSVGRIQRMAYVVNSNPEYAIEFEY